MNKKQLFLLLVLMSFAYGRRYYDPVTGTWISPDPKEQFWTPYAYAGNGFNPINATDPKGEDMIFLLNNSGQSGYGHMGFMIGSPEGGYTYFSQGTPVQDASLPQYISGVQGGMSALNVASLGIDGNGNAVPVLKNGYAAPGYTYQKVSVIETTLEQDMYGLLNAFKQISDINLGNSEYSIIKYNCADAALQAADAMGISVDDALTPVKVYDNTLESGASETYDKPTH